MLTDIDNPPMQVDPSLLNPDYGTGRMEMRPLTGSASGPSPFDTPQPPDVHEAMRDHADKTALNRVSMLSLNPNDPNYVQKLAAHQAKNELLQNDHEHEMGKMQMPVYGGPGQPVPQGQMIPPKQLPGDEFKYRQGELKDKVAASEGDPDKWAEAKGEVARNKMDNPWGSPGNHPGVLGKIGHVFGNAIGAFSPQAELQSEERGSRAAETHETEQGQKEAQTAEAQERVPQIEATTEHTKQETEDLRNKPAVEPTLLQDYTKAVQDAIAHGQDPAKSPVVQQLSDSITGIQKQSQTAEKTPPHITALGPDGKSHIMERDPQTGQYSIDRGVAPPNFAQVAPGLKTVDILNPQGIPTIQTLGGKEIGPAATGAYGHEEAQAGAVSRAGTELISELNKPENRKILGQLKTYVAQGTLGTPLADKQAAYLNSKLRTFAALQPALHGFRARTAQEAFEKMIGGLAQDPDATIAAIQGILDTAGAINPSLGGGPPTVGGKPSFAEFMKSRQQK